MVSTACQSARDLAEDEGGGVDRHDTVTRRGGWVVGDLNSYNVLSLRYFLLSRIATPSHNTILFDQRNLGE